MSNIRRRLERLEKGRDGLKFSFWDCLAGLEPPPGWELPEDVAKALAELPDTVPDLIEEAIYRVGSPAPPVCESFRQALNGAVGSSRKSPRDTWAAIV
jgi:hypothetical protein